MDFNPLFRSQMHLNYDSQNWDRATKQSQGWAMEPGPGAERGTSTRNTGLRTPTPCSGGDFLKNACDVWSHIDGRGSGLHRLYQYHLWIPWSREWDAAPALNVSSPSASRRHDTVEQNLDKQPSPKQGNEEENFFPYEGGTNNPWHKSYPPKTVGAVLKASSITAREEGWPPTSWGPTCAGCMMMAASKSGKYWMGYTNIISSHIQKI